PVEASPPSRGYRLLKLIKRNKVRVLAATLVLLALIVGIIGTSIGMVQAQNARAGETAQRQKAEGLADEKTKLADEKGQLASKNEKLAEEERDAKNKAVAALFTSQLERAGQIYEKDPSQALRLLANTKSCPVRERDLAWNFLDYACKRRQV